MPFPGFHLSSVGLTYFPGRGKQAAQDAQGEAQGDPIILEGGDSANVDGLPHSGMLEQVSTLILPPHSVTVTRAFTQLQTLLDSPLDRPPI